jgi:5-methyltetrahydropteroyltriglutamate--homocysteine methyltransferase
MPPFRAEHIGSLLRPDFLRRAHRDHIAGRIDADVFRAAQDSAITEAVRLQESLGFRAVTDGELRRVSYWAHFLDAVEGFELSESRFSFRDDGGNRWPFIAPRIVALPRRKHGISTDEFAFLKSVARAVPKITMPSPATFHFWHGGPERHFDALAEIYRDEIAELAGLGCRYIQLDDVPFAMLCDPALRDRAQVERYVALTNACLKGRPRGMNVALHLCRGNFQGRYLSTGGYDEVAERVFKDLDVDGLFLEYDSARAGGFAPLRFASEDRFVVLGLVSSKNAALEDREALKRRIGEAAKFVPISRLGLSPQCGFASAVTGNPVTEADQTAKLRLVAETARDVWGDA